MVVVVVTPPPLPVMVIVKVPVVAVLDTLIRMEAVPEPPTMEVGTKATVTPAGFPEADKAIVELKPPEGVAVILAAPRPPRATLTFLGFAARVKLPVVPLTVNETVVVCVVLPALPVTVMVYVAGVTEAPTAIVIVDVPVPVMEVGLNVTVTPLGWPLALNTTGVLNPPVVVLVMVEVPEAPCATVTEVGLAERLKSEEELVMVTARAVEGMPFAITTN